MKLFKYILGVVAVLALAVGYITCREFACTNPEATAKTLERAGYTDVEVNGYNWWECGEGDSYNTGFEATNPNGKRVIGTVCCGLWAKGCTIRF